MTTNSSATGGYLAPVGPQQPDDLDLDEVLRPIIVGITGLSVDDVWAKSQEVPPGQPDRSVTWCAFGVVNMDADTNPNWRHDGAGNGGLGQSVQFRGEELEVMASFYGPASRAAATTLRDGLGVTQNRDVLRANGLSFVSVERVTLVPELRNQRILRRADVVVRLRRMSTRIYPIENVVELVGTLVSDADGSSGRTDVTAPIDQPGL